MDPLHADRSNLGYRKSRSSNQAIGRLSKSLAQKQEAFKKNSNKRQFVRSKLVIIRDAKQFFDKVNYEWLMKNYLLPTKYIHVLKGWLSSATIFQGEHETPTTEFLKSSVIGLSLTNYTLNVIKKTITLNNQTTFDFEKVDCHIKQGHYRKIR